jgi:hypothetical protein
MPVTATLGALTYDKTNIAVIDTDHWALKSTTTSTFIDFDLDSANAQIKILGEYLSSRGYAAVVKGLSNPVINQAREFFPSSTANISPEFYPKAFVYNTANVYQVVGVSKQKFTQSFPYDDVFCAGRANLVANTANFTLTETGNIRGTWAPTGSPDFLNYDSIAKFTDGNLFVGGIISIIGDPEPLLIKYSANGTQLGQNRIPNGETALDLTSTNFIGVQESSDANVITLSTVARTANGSTTNIDLIKCNATPNSLNSNTLETIWGLVFSSANTLMYATDVKLDSSDTNYLTLYAPNNSGFLAKVDNTGNLVWQKQIANVRLTSLDVKNSNSIYSTGVTSTGNLWVGEWDNTGNIVWQNQFSTSGNFSVKPVLSPAIKTKIKNNGSDLYIGATNDSWILIKITNDGTGTGTYNFSNNQTLTYATANFSVSNGNLTTNVFSTATFGNNTSGNGLQSSAVGSALSTNRNITFV